MKKMFFVFVLVFAFVAMMATAQASDRAIGSIKLPLSSSGRFFGVLVDELDQPLEAIQIADRSIKDRANGGVASMTRMGIDGRKTASLMVSDADWHNAKKLSKVNIYSVNVNSSTTIGAQVSQFASTLEQAVELFRLAERDGAEYGYTGTRTYAYSEYGNIVGSVRLRNFIVNFVEVHHEVWTMVLNGVVVQLAQPEVEYRLAILVSEDKASPVTTAKPNNGGSNTAKPNPTATPVPTATPAPTAAPGSTPNPQNDSVILPPKYTESTTSNSNSNTTSTENKPDPQNDVVVLPERSTSSNEVVEVVNTTSTASTSSSGSSVASWTVQEVQVSTEVTSTSTSNSSSSRASSNMADPKNDEVTLVAPVR